MEQTKAVQNQKVFVQLNSVLELQAEYLRLLGERDACKAAGSTNRLESLRTRIQGMERVIKLLGLPISIPLHS